MKVIIAGSRTVINSDDIKFAIEQSGFKITEVVSGTARGADKLGEMWAKLNKIPIKQFPPEWDKLGKGAGYARNVEMAKYADALIAIWDGKSVGTKHMIDQADKHKLKKYILIIKS